MFINGKLIWEGDNHKIIYVFQTNDFYKRKSRCESTWRSLYNCSYILKFKNTCNVKYVMYILLYEDDINMLFQRNLIIQVRVNTSFGTWTRYKQLFSINSLIYVLRISTILHFIVKYFLLFPCRNSLIMYFQHIAMKKF